MKTVCKKLFSLMLVAVLLVSAIPFQASAAYGDSVTVYFRIDTLSTSFTSEEATIGVPLYGMFPSSYTVTAEYEALFSDGKVFTDKWVLAEGPKAGTVVGYDTVLSEDMKTPSGNIVLKAVFEYPEVNVYFNANGGTVDTTSKSYKMQDLYGTLPTPTKDGYTFAGWHTNVDDDSTRVTSGMKVTEDVTLYAKWATGSLPVVFQKWDATNKKWVEAERRNATTGESLRESGVSLPAQESTKYNLPRPGYEVDKDYPWVDANGNVFTVDTVINAVTYVRPNFVAKTYKLTYDFNCTELSDETVEVKYDSTLNLKQPTRANHVFKGWIYAPDSNKEVKTGDTYVWTSDITLTALWAPKGTVELRVYRDDADGFKTYYYSGAILGGELDLNDCDIQDYLKGTYDFDGWYDYNGWVSYLGTKEAKGVEYASNSITRIEKVTTSNTTNSTVTVVYGMVKGYKATTGNNVTNNNNSVNTGTADPTNPKTGDTIMIAVATMTMAAAALVAMYELKKRKMI